MLALVGLTDVPLWENHVHGLPARGDFRVGPWAHDYEDLMASQRTEPLAKRRRSSSQLRLANITSGAV
eukprot:COSAG06_NODE_266_length_18831_cov_301.960015_2_plen_68_part_00